MDIMKDKKGKFIKGHIGWWKNKKRSEEHRRKMSIAHKGQKSHFWKGGRRYTRRGYIQIWKPKHPFCTKGGYILEHRLVMEQYLGRYLHPYEKIHHKGIKYPLGGIENRQDNRIENLHLYVKGKNWHPKICPKCGFHFSIK